METRSAKRRRRLKSKSKEVTPKANGRDQHDDRISDLPCEILHLIFSFLPIRSIAQTSVLSKHWKYLWYSYPDLDFTTATIFTKGTSSGISDPRKTSARSALQRRTDDCIDQVLRLLEKNSDVRKLRFCANVKFSTLVGLMRNAFKHNLEELDLRFSTSDYFNLPRCIVYCLSLRDLTLRSYYPGFRLPPLNIMRNGFKSLNSLLLSRAVFYNQPSLVDLFRDPSFPSLTKLHLIACKGLKYLRIQITGLREFILEDCFDIHKLDIDAEKLKKLTVTCCFDKFNGTTHVKINAPLLEYISWSYNAAAEECIVENLNSLKEAVVGIFCLRSYYDSTDSILRSISNFLKGISHCQSLTLDTQCIEFLARPNHLARVQWCIFDRLKSLEINTGFNKHANEGLASLFRSSPAIHTIIINITGGYIFPPRLQFSYDLWGSTSTKEEIFWESQTQYLCSFLHHLKVVKIRGFVGSLSDGSLLKFLLMHANALEQLFCHTTTSRRTDSLTKHRESRVRLKLKSTIMGFSRASSNADIIYE